MFVNINCSQMLSRGGPPESDDFVDAEVELSELLAPCVAWDDFALSAEDVTSPDASPACAGDT